MEYQTSRVAVFKSRTLGACRLGTLLLVALFLLIRVLAQNSYMATIVPEVGGWAVVVVVVV